MTRELLSSWVTLPVYRATTLLKRLERGRGGGGKGRGDRGGERERGRRRGKKKGRKRREREGEDMEKNQIQCRTLQELSKCKVMLEEGGKEGRGRWKEEGGRRKPERERKSSGTNE